MSVKANIVHLKKGTDELHFFYDAQGKPAMVRFNGTDYFYVYDLQGDVVALIDAAGMKVVEYVYDAWGSILSTSGTLAATLGYLNPFRYRGYVFDEEIGLYYLRSRYYTPKIKRFMTLDIIIGKIRRLISHNLFAYCLNSPIIYHDDFGEFANASSKMPASYMLKLVDIMLKEHWAYVPDAKEKGKVDCIGVILYCAKQFFNGWPTKAFYYRARNE